LIFGGYSCPSGASLELGDGHYWEKEGFVVDIPLRLVGDENNPANVVIELSGQVHWRAAGGWIEGVTLRSPKMSSGEPSSFSILALEGPGKVDMIQCVFDNGGSTGDVVMASGSGNKGKWEGVVVRGGGGGISASESAVLHMYKVNWCRLSEIYFILLIYCLIDLLLNY